MAINVGLGAFNVCSNVIAVVFINIMGRRPLFLFGNIVVIVATLICGLGLLVLQGDVMIGVVVVGIAMFYFGVNFSYRGLFFVLINELPFHHKWREVASSILNALQLFENILIGLFFVPASNEIGYHSMFFILCWFAVFCFFIMLGCLEETRPSPIMKKKKKKTKEQAKVEVKEQELKEQQVVQVLQQVMEEKMMEKTLQDIPEKVAADEKIQQENE